MDSHDQAFQQLHLPRRSDMENYNHMHNSPEEIKRRWTTACAARLQQKHLEDAMPISKKAHTLPGIAGRVRRKVTLAFDARGNAMRNKHEIVGVPSRGIQSSGSFIQFIHSYVHTDRDNFISTQKNMCRHLYCIQIFNKAM